MVLTPQEATCISCVFYVDTRHSLNASLDDWSSDGRKSVWFEGHTIQSESFSASGSSGAGRGIRFRTSRWIGRNRSRERRAGPSRHSPDGRRSTRKFQKRSELRSLPAGSSFLPLVVGELLDAGAIVAHDENLAVRLRRIRVDHFVLEAHPRAGKR